MGLWEDTKNETNSDIAIRSGQPGYSGGCPYVSNRRDDKSDDRLPDPVAKIILIAVFVVILIGTIVDIFPISKTIIIGFFGISFVVGIVRLVIKKRNNR